MDVQLGDYAVNPLLVADDQGEVLYVNPAMVSFAGPLAKPGARLDNLSAALTSMAERALAGETVPGAEVRGCSGRRPVVISLTPGGFPDEHARLMAAERRWRAAYEGAPAAVLEISFDGIIVAANTATMDLTGGCLATSSAVRSSSS